MKVFRYFIILFISNLLVISVIGSCVADEINIADPKTTTMEWRDDTANLDLVKKLNEAYSHFPFSREYDGVLDQCPFRIEWLVGPNMPMVWKGGAAGIISNEVIMAGGLWTARFNRTLSYNLITGEYMELPPLPLSPEYTQGACDGTALYVVSGRMFGRHVYKLAKDKKNTWQWEALPLLPDTMGKGRWLSTVSIIPGKWLFLIEGRQTPVLDERVERQLPSYRLRLDRPNASWEPMALFPGGRRVLPQSVAVRGKVYFFGGNTDADSTSYRLMGELVTDHKIARLQNNIIYNSREAWRYDPETDRWERIRNLPFAMHAGQSIALENRYILIMGSSYILTERVGKTMQSDKPICTFYGDRILCYDIEKDIYSHVGAMLYGMSTCPWVTDGKYVYGFGGEPAHGYNYNTDNVLQIGELIKQY